MRRRRSLGRLRSVQVATSGPPVTLPGSLPHRNQVPLSPDVAKPAKALLNRPPGLARRMRGAPTVETAWLPEPKAESSRCPRQHQRRTAQRRTQGCDEGAASACSPRQERKGSAQGRNRTAHTRIFNPLLYQLSYLGLLRAPRLRRGVGHGRATLRGCGRMSRNSLARPDRKSVV